MWSTEWESANVTEIFRSRTYLDTPWTGNRLSESGRDRFGNSYYIRPSSSRSSEKLASRGRFQRERKSER